MRALIVVGLGIATLLLWIFVDQYFFCPRFLFREPAPFQGGRLYNPYENIDSSSWTMCNFHAHSKAWNGITNGKGDAHDIWSAYDSLGYGVHLVSDYHKIDFTYEYKKNFIPAYEHGYNLKKVHYLVLGSSSVHWRDFLLPQLASNKQYTLNEISQGGALLMINHPDVRNGFSDDDLRYLNGYQYMEVLSPYANGVKKWDMALSSGKPVFISGNDDIHNVYNHRSLGRFCTWVNSRNGSRENFLEAMRRGASYAMEISQIQDEKFSQKANRFKTQLPKLLHLQLQSDVITVQFDQPATIIFSGQHGRELARALQGNDALYVFKDYDSYVRITAIFGEGTKIYLNPVFRYENKPLTTESPRINHSVTQILGITGVLVLLSWGLIVIKVISGKARKGRVIFPTWKNS